VLGVIVVPGNAVIIEESEEFFLVLVDPSFQGQSNLSRTSQFRDVAEKALGRPLVLSEISLL
jgi:hypothetical protein